MLLKPSSALAYPDPMSSQVDVIIHKVEKSLYFHPDLPIEGVEHSARVEYHAPLLAIQKLWGLKVRPVASV